MAMNVQRPLASRQASVWAPTVVGSLRLLLEPDPLQWTIMLSRRRSAGESAFMRHTEEMADGKGD
jgi:hypothetical protein